MVWYQNNTANIQSQKVGIRYIKGTQIKQYCNGVKKQINIKVLHTWSSARWVFTANTTMETEYEKLDTHAETVKIQG